MIWRLSSGSNICLEQSILITRTNEIRNQPALIYHFYVNLDSWVREMKKETASNQLLKLNEIQLVVVLFSGHTRCLLSVRIVFPVGSPVPSSTQYQQRISGLFQCQFSSYTKTRENTNIQQIKHTVITCTMTQIDRTNRHSIREVKEAVSHTTHKDLEDHKR